MQHTACRTLGTNTFFEGIQAPLEELSGIYARYGRYGRYGGRERACRRS